MNQYRFIGGIVLLAFSVIMFFLGYGNTVLRSALGTIGIVLIAVSRKKTRHENESK